MPLFTTDDLIDAVGGEERLTDICIDRGSNFINGKITSAFDAVQNDVSVSYLSSTLSDTMDMATTVVMSPALVSEIVGKAMTIVNNELSKKMNEVAALPMKLAVDTTSLVKQYTQKAFNDNKITFAKALEEVSVNQEDTSKATDDENDTASDENQKKSLLQKAADVKKSIDKFTQQIQLAVSDAAKYTAEGPKWLSQKINTYLENEIKSMDESLDKKKAEMFESHDKWCQAQGEKAGKKLADEYNKVLRKTAKSQYDKIKKVNAEAKALTFSAKQKAKLKIMALTGINIPV